ncbi:MAG: hypothetical protein QXH24_02180 [Candidatus Bathyarchaeia archaeon]
MDIGKNAVTLVKRGVWRDIRVYISSEKIRKKYFSKEAMEIFRFFIGTPLYREYTEALRWLHPSLEFFTGDQEGDVGAYL